MKGFALQRILHIFKSSSQNSQKFLVDNQVFPEKGIEWCIVDRKDVVPKNGNEGLVRLVKVSNCDNKKYAVAWIKDNGDMRISPFRVPIEEIEFKSERSEKCRSHI